jgi:hypothetical protein
MAGWIAASNRSSSLPWFFEIAISTSESRKSRRPTPGSGDDIAAHHCLQRFRPTALALI